MGKLLSIDEYISTFPGETQDILQKIRRTMHGVITNAEEGISYGIPVLKANGKNVVFFAGWKDHVAVYPIPSGDDDFQKEIAPFKTGKGTLHFPLDKPIPYDLIKKITRHHLQEKDL